MDNKRQLMIQLLKQYERNPDQFSDRQAENIAKMASEIGYHFPRESKFGRKLAFDALDTALLGLVPNKYRPVSRGDATFGESDTDKWAGRIGTGLGIVGTGGLALARGGKVLGKGLGYGQKAGSYGIDKGAEYAGKAHAYARQVVKNAPRNINRAGIRYGSAQARYAQAKSGGLTSMERGSRTSWFSNLRDEFRRGQQFANPMSTYDPNLLMLTAGRGGIPLAGNAGVML